MKKLIPLLLLLGGAVSGFAQGTVNFRNNVQATPDPVNPNGAHWVYAAGSPIDSTTGVGLVGTQYVAELYAGTSAGSLTPITASISRFRQTTSSNVGRWGTATIAGVANDSVVLPGILPAGTAFLQVAVWNYDANGGAGNANNTFENAAGLKNASLVFTYKVASPGDPPANFVMENLPGFALVPEPSAIALGVMGVAGLLLIRRRK
jgi:hypothetical protein